MSGTSSECRLSGIPHFDFEITEKNLETSAKTLISHIKKHWDVTKMLRKDFNDGKTNSLFGFYVKEGGMKVSTTFGQYGRSDIVLIRIYGQKTEIFLDRAQELRNFNELSRNNIAPPLYCTFSNGYCYKFLEGRVLEDEFMVNECAKLIAHLHSIKLSEDFLRHHHSESPWLFTTIHKFIKLIQQQYTSETNQKRFEELPSLESLISEVDCMKNAIEKLTNPQMSFCHNDLLRANLIFDDREDILKCIDYEYGSLNYSAYDIGNNFNEFAGMDVVDYSLYPNEKMQMSYLKTYLEEYNKCKGISEEVNSKKIHNLYVHVNQFALVSHLFWGFWSMLQAQFSEIDFGFAKYADIRFKEYFKRKEEFLSLTEHK